MYASRRHYRRLLLPPGWVALGFLLLLGCQALLTHERQLRLPNVVQITMPPLQPNKVDVWGVPVYGSITELDKFRPWRDAEFTGALLNDFIHAATIEHSVQAINTDTSRGGGVRIRFGQHAVYGNLVKVLDIMNRLNQKKYWLDIHHKPVTLYAITDKPLPVEQSSQPVWLCGTRYYEYPVPTEVLTFRQVLKTFWEQNWRPSVLVLSIISALSLYRLSQRCPAR